MGGQDVPELARQISDELRAVQNESELPNPSFGLVLPTLSVAPDKPRQGLTVIADGTNWNPGAGAGVYTYYSNAWNRLG